MSEQETVRRTVTVVLPKEADAFLQELAALNGMTVETMFQEEIMNILSGFYECGHFEAWTENATENAKRIEETVKAFWNC